MALTAAWWATVPAGHPCEDVNAAAPAAGSAVLALCLHSLFGKQTALPSPLRASRLRAWPRGCCHSPVSPRGSCSPGSSTRSSLPMRPGLHHPPATQAFRASCGFHSTTVSRETKCLRPTYCGGIQNTASKLMPMQNFRKPKSGYKLNGFKLAK